MSQIKFFMLKDDQIELIKRVEEKIKIEYIEYGNFEINEKINKFSSGLEIPSIGISDGNQPAQCTKYVIYLSGNNIKHQEFIDNYGKKRICIDQLINNDTIVLQLGGMWNNEAIISGTIGSAYSTGTSKKLLNVFIKEIKKNLKIKAFYVGNKAYQYFKNGGRLACCAIDSPKEYDLKE